jgi:uncharacterized SAM-binding protein YcdF (DUF218 family)
MTLFNRPARAFFQIIGVLSVLTLLAAAAGAMVLPRILQLEDKLQKADYILPLAGDWHRLIRAAELYKAGYAPRVLLSNSRLRPPERIDRLKAQMGIQRQNPRQFRDALMAHLEVPPGALAAFGEGHISTVEEAEAFREFLKQRKSANPQDKPLRIILVTSPYHTRRAKMIFEDTIPSARFMVASPPEDRLAAQWWRDQRSARIAVSESFKLTFYLLGGRFHSRAAKP